MKVALVSIDPLITTPKPLAGGAVYNLAAYLKSRDDQNKISTRIFVFNSLVPQCMIDALKIYEYGPMIVGFSCYCWNIAKVLRISNLLKRMLPEITIVLGGPEVSYNSESILKENPQVDIIVIGEGEVTFSEIVSHFNGIEVRLKDIDGIAFRRGDAIELTKPRVVIANLDEIPSVFLSGLVDLQSSRGVALLETVRGCIYHCSFCLYTKNLISMRSYSWNRIEDEIRNLCNSQHIHTLYFADPTFNANEERALKILDMVEKFNPEISLILELKAEIMTEQIVKKLSHLAIKELDFGLQSSNQMTNKNIYRYLDKTKFLENITLIRRIFPTPPNIDIDVIVGLPGDTFDDYKSSVEFALSCCPTRVYYQPLRLLPGSRISYDTVKFDLVYDPLSPNNILHNSTFSEDDLIKALKLNAGLDYYQGNATVRRILDILSKASHLSVTEICEMLGDFLWQQDLLYNFRLCNLTPDDRPSENYLSDFIRFLEGWNTSLSDEERILILQLTKSLSEDLESRKQDFNPGYYSMAI